MAAPAAVLNVLVTANTGGASASLTRLDRQLKGTAATAKVSSNRVAKAAKYMGAGVAAGLGASVAAAAKFESAFAEVRKTVDASEKGFARIRRGLLDLSTQIPESANELANLAGEAGALGIASKDIVRFTKTAAQLGTTTNLASEDAATALARLSNILNVKGRDAFERMGSVLVDLGNKGASTEREITEMSLRIARGAATIGLSAKEVLGLSASLANIGIRADAGGTAVSRALLQMNESVKEGGEQLETFAKVSGMTTDEFSALFKKSAPEALDAFARGLKDLDKEGKPLLETLRTVQLNEIRVRDALLGLGSAAEGVAKSQNVANKAWRENNALSKEARQRYATFESQLKLLKNSIVKLGIDIGTKMLPDLKDMVGILRDPKLTLDQKVEQLGEKLGQMIGEWAPKVAKAVAKVGAAMAKGLADAFLDAPIWGKLIMGGLLIRAIGGRGAVLGLGAKIGGWLGIGTAAGMAGRGGAAAGAAAGAGIGAKIGGVFKNIKWARVGVLGAGIAAGSVLLKGLEDQAARGSEDIFERINAQIKRKSFLGMTSFLGDQDVFGLKVLQEGAPELQGMVNHLQTLVETGRAIPVHRYENFAEVISNAEIDPNLRRDLEALLDMAGGRVARATKQIRGGFDRAFNLKDLVATHKSNLATIQANFGKNTQETRRLSRVAKQAMIDHLRDLVDDGQVSMKRAGRFLRRFGMDVDDLTPKTKELSQKARKHFAGVADGAEDTSRSVKGSFRSMVDGSSDAIELLKTNTNNALKAMGAKTVDFSVKKTASNIEKGANKIQKKQRGGPIDMGKPSGDSVPAMLERGEYVLNRKAVAAIGKENLDALNFKVASRFQKGGGVGGGLKFALGPYTIPPIQYDANHAGGNSHLHIAMSSVAAAKAIAARMKKMGWRISEAPWAGGVAPIHKDPGHYSGSSFDANTDADETRAEVAAVARLLRGKGGGLAVARLAKLMLEGPSGALLDIGQSAIDKVHKAAQRLLDRSQPHMMALGERPANVSGPLQEIAKRMVLSQWGPGQWPYFNDLVTRESGWNPRAVNPDSGAAGLAQALPPSKYPPGAWPYTGKDSAVKQLQWMVGYIQERYGNPARAIAWHNSHNWYQKGGAVMPPYGGSFAKGGTVPGPKGAPRTVIAHGGETITPPGQQPIHVTVVVKDGAVRRDAIEVIAEDVVLAHANANRRHSRMGRR